MMSWLHLIWIVPVTLAVGVVIGYSICARRIVKAQIAEYDKIHWKEN